MLHLPPESGVVRDMVLLVRDGRQAREVAQYGCVKGYSVLCQRRWWCMCSADEVNMEAELARSPCRMRRQRKPPANHENTAISQEASLNYAPHATILHDEQRATQGSLLLFSPFVSPFQTPPTMKQAVVEASGQEGWSTGLFMSMIP